MKITRKTRNLISVFLVGAASLYFVVLFLEVPGGEVFDFFLAVLAFVVGLMMLSVLTIALVKGLSRLFRRR
jgi:hypothetical protein